ncbi:MAG TPA: arginine--tRNA ligase [Anaerohalosphaeraceae bacterium]|nr:arginine--tRNA ligase [Anaerohalosphaeraceae bacterium]HOM75247.1 arginine--tRNA ligase [Anaerohalosphaeraceae bacterium]HPC64520.1 arginine--tRNA ligase [Anaerohalosphaeraceae bacterium]HPO69441.1 arginine--tRNA ligase [Anaerohalosphaeraceae bacterium]HRS71512.1 arginine--tRNA ligase [Anaerohalosphaeraceae bacterium]
MKRLTDILEERISGAIRQVTGRSFPAMVRPAAEPKYGDYQANGIMPAAKQIKTNPRQLAQQVAAVLDIADICQPPEIAGPGFINLRLKDEFLAARLIEINSNKQRLGIEKTKKTKTVVVDYSGPNIAKQMHVGHLRSTIIGDCIARLYEFQGHTVIRQNHIGDWGTQFGMLIALLKEQYPHILDNLSSAHIADLETFYQDAKRKSEEDKTFEQKARQEVVRLHNHDADTILVWKQIVQESRKHYLPIYKSLNIMLTADDERGESFYADKLASVVEEFKGRRLASESDGAICIFPEGFKNKEGQPLPFIIQKSDGAFLYATTDLAALRYRIQELHADTIIYVTDARQSLHFQMLFAAAKMAGWTDSGTELVHVTFGTMLGEDGKPFKTRSGGTVKLKDLLDEAVERARKIVEEKNPSLSAEQKEHIAQAVGIGAVKYADYSNNRNSDYVFSFDKMLAMDGNTAPYMQYAYARIKSIERKASGREVDIKRELSGLCSLSFTSEAEKELAKLLIRYDQAIDAAAQECRPNYLTGYLYDLSQAFSRFYAACPVLEADAQQRPLRLLLCDLTARTIRHGMSELLGIEVVEHM